MNLRTTLALLRLRTSGVGEDLTLSTSEAAALWEYIHELEKDALRGSRDKALRRDVLIDIAEHRVSEQQEAGTHSS